MSSLIDTLYTYKFVKILSTKWEDMDAYKLGIIDEDGEPLKKSSQLSVVQEKAYTRFHRLVFKIKRLMEKVPGGKSATVRYSAAINLIREDVGNMTISFDKIERVLKECIEEEVANGVDGIAGKEQPLGDDKIQKRKKKKEKVVEENTEQEYIYEMVGNAVVRLPLDEAGKAKKMKVRVKGNKKQRKLETSTDGIYTRTGNRKLRGAKLVRKRKSLRKTIRKAHTAGAETKRKRSKKKLSKLS